jgi:hypothetical protein
MKIDAVQARFATARSNLTKEELEGIEVKL